jgi:hypothetical protein
MNDGVDFMKKLWGSASSAVPGLGVPGLSVDDLEKKITDLRAVEGWLGTHLSLLRTTIQSLEVQRNTMIMLHSLGSLPTSPTAAGAGTSTPEATQTSAAMAQTTAWWNLLQEQFAKTAQGVFPATSTPPTTEAQPNATRRSAPQPTATASAKTPRKKRAP